MTKNVKPKSLSFMDEIYAKVAEIESKILGGKKIMPTDQGTIYVCALSVGPFCAFNISQQEFLDAIRGNVLCQIEAFPPSGKTRAHRLVYTPMNQMLMNKLEQNHRLAAPAYGFVSKNLIIAPFYEKQEPLFLFIKRGNAYSFDMRMQSTDAWKDRPVYGRTHFCQQQANKKHDKEYLFCLLQFLETERSRENHPSILQMIEFEHNLSANIGIDPIIQMKNDKLYLLPTGGSWESLEERKKKAEKFIQTKIEYATLQYNLETIDIFSSYLRNELSDTIHKKDQKNIELLEIAKTSPTNKKKIREIEKEIKGLDKEIHRISGIFRKIRENTGPKIPKKLLEEIENYLHMIGEPEADTIFLHEPDTPDPLWDLFFSRAEVFKIGNYDFSLETYLAYQEIEEEIFRRGDLPNKIVKHGRHITTTSYLTDESARINAWNTFSKIHTAFLEAPPFILDNPSPAWRYLKFDLLERIQHQIMQARKEQGLER